jgi:hypothetical protein
MWHTYFDSSKWYLQRYPKRSIIIGVLLMATKSYAVDATTHDATQLESGIAAVTQ